MKIYLIFFFLIACEFSAKAQTFATLSKFEKRWVILHPFAAIKCKKLYKKIKPILDKASDSDSLDSFSNGGKLDAFRHAFVMGVYAQKINPKKVRKLGVAHERGNYIQYKHGIAEDGELPDSLSSVMDLKNNELGIEIGKSNSKLSPEKLKSKVIEAIRDGNAVFFRRDENGNYLTCEGNVISKDKYKSHWSIPKCLTHFSDSNKKLR